MNKKRGVRRAKDRKLLEEITSKDRRKGKLIGEIVSEKRLDLELAWSQTRFIDKTENRQARSRTLIARARLIQPVITMDFWENELDQWLPVWDEMLATIKVGMELPKPPPAGWN